jgi:hypothetical protein
MHAQTGLRIKALIKKKKEMLASYAIVFPL